MELSEFAAVAVFVAVVLFGIVDAIGTPLKIKGFYRGRSYTDQGKKNLPECSGARILDAMYTERFFTNSTSGVSQCKSWSIDRRKFTFSKAARKRNRTPWSVTIVEGDFSHLSCLILPTVVPEAITYVGNGENMDFESDLEVANRYHIVTDNEALIKSTIVGELRSFLLKAHIVFIEVTNHQLVMKRNWADHQVIERLEQELAIAALLKERLGERPEGQPDKRPEKRPEQRPEGQQGESLEVKTS